MTHPNYQTNGASLEDCHTNFFALTELSGIKWRKLVWNELNGGGNLGTSPPPASPLDDPVLQSYARCLAADILCVWRRVSTPRPPPDAFSDAGVGPPPPLTLTTSKELWIFWYGEEPDLNVLISPELNTPDYEQGSWESGLSYECRSLLFKALHNLIERCLLSRGFIRLGKWFVQPYEVERKLSTMSTSSPSPSAPQTGAAAAAAAAAATTTTTTTATTTIHPLSPPQPPTPPLLPPSISPILLDSSNSGNCGGGGSHKHYHQQRPTQNSPSTSSSANHLSFSFVFFVHGESSVCASVDVRQHPPVRKLTRFHVQQAQSSNQGLKVILAPFGLSATLTGQCYYKTPEMSARLLDDWSRFYPVDKSTNLIDSSVVEVVVGGVKMRYPSCYVLVTDMDDAVNAAVLNSPPPPPQPPMSPPPSISPSPLPPPPPSTPSNHHSDNFSPIVLRSQQAPQVPPPPIEVNSRVPHPGPHMKSVEMQRENTAATVLPECVWHDCINNKRMSAAASTEFTGQWSFTDPARRTNCTCSKCSSASSPVAPPPPQPQPLSSGGGSTTPSYSGPRTQESQGGATGGGIPSVGSDPASITAPSPLTNPQSQAPASVPPPPLSVGPTNSNEFVGMPALSPHTGGGGGGGSVTNHSASPLIDSAKPTPLPAPMTVPLPLKSLSSPKMNAAHQVVTTVLRRPQLPANDYDDGNGTGAPSAAAAASEEEHTLDMLYDYTTLTAWLNHPVKRFKPDPNYHRKLALNRGGFGGGISQKGDLYAMYASTVTIQSAPLLAENSSPFTIKQEIIDDDLLGQVTSGGSLKRSFDGNNIGDPYEFDEDGGGGTMNNGFQKRVPPPLSSGGGGSSTATSPADTTTTTKKSSSMSAMNLYTSEGLQPSYRDLEQIFDNSDDTSSDEAIQIQTPPGSAGGGVSHHHHHHHNSSSSSGGGGHSNSQSSHMSCGGGGGGGTSSGILRPEELSKMFPTPPSLEHNPIASPCGSQLDTMLSSGGGNSGGGGSSEYTEIMVRSNATSITTNVTANNNNNNNIKLETTSTSTTTIGYYMNLGSPQEELVDDWSYVFKPAATSKMLGSSKYAPLTNLPSQSLASTLFVPPTFPMIYKPSWLVQHQQARQSPKPSDVKRIQSSPAAVAGPPPPAVSAPPPTVTPPIMLGAPSTPNNMLMGGGSRSCTPSPNFPPHHQSMGGAAAFRHPPPPPYEAVAYMKMHHLSPQFHPHHHPPHHASPHPPVPLPPPAPPEANSLALTILLTDTAANLFRDHNFDSCTLCVCNAGPRCVGNIRGADAGVYLTNYTSATTPPPLQHQQNYGGGFAQNFMCGAPNSSPFGGGNNGNYPYLMSPQQQHHHLNPHHLQHHHQQQQQQQQQWLEEESIRCSCGFSAVVNRRLACNSGLFYEDEMEITGCAQDPSDSRKASLVAFLSKISGGCPPSTTTNNDIDSISHTLLELIREQCVFIPNTVNAIGRTASRQQRTTILGVGGGDATGAKTSLYTTTTPIHLIEFRDSNEVSILALEQCRHLILPPPPPPPPPHFHSPHHHNPHVPLHHPHHPHHNPHLPPPMCCGGGSPHPSHPQQHPHHHMLPPAAPPPPQMHLLHHHPQQQQQRLSSSSSSAPIVHKWPFLRANGPQSTQDVVRIMRHLQPMLQEAIQKKCQTRLWEAPSAVKGPLTWRQFHRLAGRGTDDRCEPQPIPAIIVGHERDWLSLSPYAVLQWDTLLLEPYSFPRDIAYIVVAPDNEVCLPRVRHFFRELSAAYEMCKLGRHAPITKVLRDGILRVGRTAKHKLANEPIENWFQMLGDGELIDMLKLYAQVCKHHLAPHLLQIPMDRTLLDPPPDASGGGCAGGVAGNSCSAANSNASHLNNDSNASTASPMPPPTPETLGAAGDGKAPSTPKNEPDSLDGKDGLTSGGTPLASGGHSTDGAAAGDEDSREAPFIVIYLIEPFSFGSDDTDVQRLACIALLRCFESVLQTIPEQMRHNISVQLISMESIAELSRTRDRCRQNGQLRMLSLNIFSQCRRLLVHSNNVKSLTGFGTAAMADLFLKSKDEKNRAPYKLFAPPFILAPLREKVESAESFGKSSAEQSSVLYLSYCLSDDQSWLLAAATDERGEIFETITINIDIPNRRRRRKVSARRIGLEKLMTFILGVMSQCVRPWRLVVGRLGRIGHGELKGWSWLLSRKNLLKASKHLKDICNQCSLMYPNTVPCILSACLVSLEADTVLRLMADQFTPDERFSQASVNSQLSTPHDVTCTHILVFPTSATTQSSQTAFQEQHITPELGDDELFSALNDDMPEGIDGVNDFSDIFNWTEAGLGGGQSPTGRDGGSGPSSPSDLMMGVVGGGGNVGGGSGGGGGIGAGGGLGGIGGGGGLGGMMGGGGALGGSGGGCNGAGGQRGGIGGGGADRPFGHGGSATGHGGGGGMMAKPEVAEEVGTLLQQPLALGYFVSTAPTGPLPKWFWAACPHLEGVCPAFLKNALHLHSPNIQQSSEDLFQQSAVTSHPLDSTYTTDVLRYVLEGYNALSWLALDSNTHDRQSCLPVHMQVLVQLYHTAAALV